MSMPFEIRGASPTLRDGDRIAATLAVTDSGSWLENVKVTAVGPVPGGTAPAGGAAAPGVMAPALSMIDQDGRTVTLTDFAGRVLVVTFIYTRCPLPDFCPLMVRHLERVRQRANEEGIGRGVAFLGVTLDPAFDTPGVLEAYGQSVLKGADRFDQWTLATGTASQIGDLARFFGVGYKPETGVITHTLMTAVVGADSRVMRVFPSNSWTPDELFERVRQGSGLAAIK
jgi:protein SCO1/2